MHETKDSESCPKPWLGLCVAEGLASNYDNGKGHGQKPADSCLAQRNSNSENHTKAA